MTVATLNADAVRTALTIRDQVLTFLPAYSQWLARSRPSEDWTRERERIVVLNNLIATHLKASAASSQPARS